MKLIFCFSFFLLGCSSPSEIFDSEPGKGAGNKSITEVNHMINQGIFLEKTSNTIEKNTQKKERSFQKTPERNFRIWIAPFQDENGDFHEASYVHTVIRSGLWRIES